LQKTLLGLDDNDDGIYEELARKQGKNRFETPKGDTMSCSFAAPTPATAKKTPHSRVDEYANMLKQT